MSRLIRFGPGSLSQLGEVLSELGVDRALLVTTRRGARAVAAYELPVVGVFDGVRPHVPVETPEEPTPVGAEVDGTVDATPTVVPPEPPEPYPGIARLPGLG